MTLLVFLAAAVATVDAPRSRHAVRPGSDAPSLAAMASAAVLAACTALALVAEPLLDLVAISASTWRIATGLLLVATGLLTMGGPMPGPEPGLPGRRAWLVPVAFPTLFTPGLAALVVAASADLGAPAAVLGSALGLTTLPLLAGRDESPVRRRVLDGVGRGLAALLVPIGFALLFDGVFDI